MGRKVGVGDMGEPFVGSAGHNEDNVASAISLLKASLRYLPLLTTTPVLGQNPLIPRADDGGVETSLSFPKALSWCYDCAFGGGVLGITPWASLVAALGGIAPCFIVFLGELLCLPTVRRPPIQGGGGGPFGSEVDEVLSMLLVGVDDNSFSAASLLTTLPSGLSLNAG
ncbi:hypothetical protein QYE76_005604 [Lolium multiflorum]|uniref:Uncharacterized protein n=1 Tax=Lolium multiflorum TaxID=4521 RepID=A0AAD8RV19_LOLMU|nr:hypothetical protein QYE76_005604 [Lolium multiflorum]